MHLLVSYLFLFLAFSLGVASEGYPTSICDTLSSVLTTSVFFPDTPTYNTSITSYPFTQLQLHPTCIVRPQNAQEVSTAIGLLRKNRSSKFAVKGGGHNANAGFNNIEDGVTIDMQSMNATEVGEDVVRVGAGALWQNVYDAVGPLNLTVLGGRIGVVGVAGFATGGGISFFSPERGWACDGVANFEIVLANGTIVNANETSNPDLFAALKGGQSNFGIITRFDVKTFAHGPIWGGRILYAPLANTSTALLSAYTGLKMGEYDPYAAGWVTIGYNGSSKLFTPSATMWYTKPELKPGAMANITSIQPQTLNGMTTAEVGALTSKASINVKAVTKYTIWATTTFRINPTIMHSIYARWNELVPKFCDTYASAKPTADLTFQSLAAPPRNGAPPNSLGFAPTDTPEKDLVFLQAIFYFSDGSAMEGFNNALKELIAQFDAIADQEGVSHPFRYLNFAAKFQDPLASYGEAALEGLRSVARKFDPEGIFQKQLIGGFKVGHEEQGYGDKWGEGGREGKGWRGKGWSGKGWSGKGWSGKGWSGKGWSGKGWSGKGWSGKGWRGKGY